MEHHIKRLRNRVDVSALIVMVSAIAAAVYVPYALSKGQLTTVIVTESWQFFGLTPEQMALLVHLFETVPLVLIALGLASFHVDSGADGRLVAAGLSITLAGFALTIITHLGEHLLPPLVLPSLTGAANWFLWSYYLSWLLLFTGLAIYGIGLSRTELTISWIPGLFVLALPVTVVVGLSVVALEVFTFAGTFRLVLGIGWLFVGLWMWRRGFVSAGSPASQSR